MDALSDVLRAAHLTGGVFLHAEFTAPWCVAARLTAKYCGAVLGRDATHLIAFHYVAEGGLQLRVDGAADAIALAAGDIVVLPQNDLHRFGSDVSLPPVMGHDIIQPPQGPGLHTIRHGGGGASTRMVCGFLGCESPGGNPVLATLPQVLRLSVADAGAAHWIRSTFHYAADEVAAGRPGSSTVLAKLSELLFVEAVRRYSESLAEDQTGWFAGLRDRQVARVLALIHADVARPWTVDTLGREVGMSRSALAERFTRLMGAAPMHYLATWRMQLAAAKLRSSSAALAQIAADVGYESEAAFSRAFKRAFGVAPAAWRRSHAG